MRFYDERVRLAAVHRPPAAMPTPSLTGRAQDIPWRRLKDYRDASVKLPSAVSKPYAAPTYSPMVERLSVDPQDLEEARAAVDEFAVVWAGADLPLSARGRPEWTVVGDPHEDAESKRGSWGGQTVAVRAFDPEMFGVLAWGVELLMSVEFWRAYVADAYVEVSTAMLALSATGRSGVMWDALAADLRPVAAGVAGGLRGA